MGTKTVLTFTDRVVYGFGYDFDYGYCFVYLRCNRMGAVGT